MVSLKVSFITLFVIFISVGVIYASSVNTCGNLGTASPVLAQECTGVKYQNGTCCYVENASKNINYCVLLLGTPKKDAINNFQSEINTPGITVDCHSEFLTYSMLFLILALFLI